MPEGAPTIAGFKDAVGDLGPYGTWPYLERRHQEDRRLTGTRLFSRYIFRGRRAGGRRAGEGRNVYVDRYHSRDLALAVAILALNLLDAFLTLVYVEDDLQREANPFAKYLIQLGTEWFVFSKAVVVAACILFLVVHKTFRFVRPALLFLFAFYLMLFVYHLAILCGLPELVASRM